MLLRLIKAAPQVIFDMTVEKAWVCTNEDLVAGVYAQLQQKPSSVFLVVPARQS